MYNTDVCGDDLDVYPRRLLKNEAYQKIKDFLFDDISERVYSERQLATALNLGLGSVRSAIERLRAESLIAVLPNSGIRVPELTAHSIIDFYEFRSIVEAHVVASLAGRLTQAQIAQVEAILANQEECVVRGRSQNYHDLDMQFHIALAEFHGNREIVRNLWQLRDKMYRLSSGLHRSHPERLGVNAKQHRAIWREICLGNGAKAMGLLRTHLQWGQSCTLDPTMRGVRLDDRIGMVEWAGDPMSRDLRVAATSQASQTEGDR